MRKRVAITRAIAYNLKYILYDEQTTVLDPLTSNIINNLIQKMQHELNIKLLLLL